MRKRALVAALATLAWQPAGSAWAAALPPVSLPVALQDIGAPNACPFVLLSDGQSNDEGFDSLGSKVVQPNVYITNSLTNPTAIVPAAFGAAPLNVGWNGTTQIANATQAQAYNNVAVWFANNLSLSGMLTPGRKILIIPNWFSGNSIGNWVGAGTSSVNWTYLLAQLSFIQSNLQTSFPGCSSLVINHEIKVQGEADGAPTVPTAYNSLATYAPAWATWLAQTRALPQWQASTTISVQELGLFYDHTEQFRNDFLRSLRKGAYDPYITLVGASGATESAQNPGLHFDGNALVMLGRRHFQAWLHARLSGGYNPDTTYYNSAIAFPNLLVAPTSGTASYSYDDLQTGGTIVGNLSTINLPDPTLFTQGEFVTCIAVGTLTVHQSNGIGQENTTARAASVSLPGGGTTNPYVYRLTVVNGFWTLESVYPRFGNLLAYAQTTAAGAQLGLVYANTRYAQYRLSGNPVGMPTPVDGALIVFSNATGASYLGASASAGSATGGAGYVVGEVLTVAGGTGSPSTITVSGIGAGGAITSASLTAIGAYTAFPTGTLTQASSTGVGTGASITLTKRGGSDLYKVPGAADQASYSIGGTNQVVELMSMAGAWTVMFDSALTQKRLSGPTANRPSLSATDVGVQYYDTTLGKPVWWNGAAWKDATGATV